MWLYKGQEFTDDLIGKSVGFVYLITNKVSGRQYVGKKLFQFRKTKKPLKGKVNKRHSKVQSDWKEYFGSNDELKQDVILLGEENFHREILHLCPNKAVTSYYEMKEILDRGAILSDNFYNGWISCRLNRNQLMEIGL